LHWHTFPSVIPRVPLAGRLREGFAPGGPGQPGGALGGTRRMCAAARARTKPPGWPGAVGRRCLSPYCARSPTPAIAGGTPKSLAVSPAIPVGMRIRLAPGGCWSVIPDGRNYSRFGRKPGRTGGGALGGLIAGPGVGHGPRPRCLRFLPMTERRNSGELDNCNGGRASGATLPDFHADVNRLENARSRLGYIYLGNSPGYRNMIGVVKSTLPRFKVKQ
jgi:hypothetical protein